MRYTRYNYKKNNKNNNSVMKTVLSFVVMSMFVIIVGVLLANIIIYFLPLNDAVSVPKNEALVEQSQSGDTVDNGDGVTNAIAEGNEGDVVTNGQSVINTSFTAVQVGYFAVSDNANAELSKISKDYGAFIYNDADKFKVLAGVYTASEAESIMSKLTAAGMQCAKVSFNLDSSSKVHSQISGIVNGYLELLTTSLKDDVTAVDTSDFKGWVSELEVINDGEQVSVLNELKNHINEAPVELKKGDVSVEMEYIYKVLLNFN